MTSSFFTLANAIRATILFGLFIILLVLVQSCQVPKTGLERFAVDSLRKLQVREAPPPLPNPVFTSADGEELILSDLKGKVIVLNIWATWCPPCVKEMPSLDRLQALRGGETFEVITISLDRTKYEPAKFFADNGIENLVPYHDGSFGVPGQLRLYGYPSTLIYNADGREIALLQGEAEWDSDEALALVDYLLDQ